MSKLYREFIDQHQILFSGIFGIVEPQIQSGKKGIKMSEKNETLIGKAITMNDLASYQPGSVVSRTLIDKKIGTLTLFAFDQGQGLSEHTAPYDAFVQVMDGTAAVTIDGKVHQVAAGQMIIMPANVPHSLKAEEPFKMLLVMIRA
jgi:quercetin dioxygenase-like cupin family protein